jgi:hypothetical protein
VADSLRNALNEQSLPEVDTNAQIHIVILSEKLPRSELEKLLNSGFRIVLLLISNLSFRGDGLLERASSLQLVDYRSRSESVLHALALTLKDSTERNLPLGSETLPPLLNSTVLPQSLQSMAVIVAVTATWLILSSIVSLIQALGNTAPVPLLNWVGLVCGLIWIRLGTASLQRETTNARFFPALLISTWLAVPLAFGSICLIAVRLASDEPFDWPITLYSLFTEPENWICLIFPGGFVVAGTALAWRRRLRDWLPESVSRPPPGDRFEPLKTSPAGRSSWRAPIMTLILVALCMFGYPAGISALMAFLSSRP